MKPTILIVDDDQGILHLWELKISHLGYNVVTASNGAEAEMRLNERIPDVALLDLRLPDTSGIVLLEKIKAMAPDVPVLIVSAAGTISEAVHAMKLGAYDFLVKPEDANQRIEIAVTNAIELRRLKADMQSLRSLVGGRRAYAGMVGQSPPMQRIYSQIDNIAPTMATVLITGESGVGKELVARAIHDLSPRAGQPFVAINCAAIPQSLLESQLFGHERGAFTGANRMARGKFEIANNGTLFLDEIGEMPIELQSKLLRVLQDHAFYRVGGEREIKVDVRLITATNRDIDAIVERKEFREDLFYRLDVVRITTPPLRDRPNDIPLLAIHFLKLFSKKYDKLFQAFSTKSLDILRNIPWRGNVRELQNTIERVVALHNGEVVEPEMLPAAIVEAAKNFKGSTSVKNINSVLPSGDGKSLNREDIIPFEELEKLAIDQALNVCKGNAIEAAGLLKISSATIYRKIKKYGLGKK